MLKLTLEVHQKENKPDRADLQSVPTKYIDKVRHDNKKKSQQVGYDNWNGNGLQIHVIKIERLFYIPSH